MIQTSSLVRARTALVNTARGLTKSYGERLRGCNPRNMDTEKAQTLSPELQVALGPLLQALESLSERITEYNQRIEAIAQQSYPQTAVLKRIQGSRHADRADLHADPEDPHSFRKSRDAGCYTDCNRNGEERTTNRRCTSAKEGNPRCKPCWCREHTTSSPNFWS